MGGNLVHFARTGVDVVGVDINAARIPMARQNLGVYCRGFRPSSQTQHGSLGDSLEDGGQAVALTRTLERSNESRQHSSDVAGARQNSPDDSPNSLARRQFVGLLASEFGEFCNKVFDVCKIGSEKTTLLQGSTAQQLIGDESRILHRTARSSTDKNLVVFLSPPWGGSSHLELDSFRLLPAQDEELPLEQGAAKWRSVSALIVHLLSHARKITDKVPITGQPYTHRIFSPLCQECTATHPQTYSDSTQLHPDLRTA